MLLIMSIHFLILEVRDAWRRHADGGPTPRWAAPLGVFAALSIAAGTFHYLVLAGVTSY